jgi:hypothetical protein
MLGYGPVAVGDVEFFLDSLDSRKKTDRRETDE